MYKVKTKQPAHNANTDLCVDVKTLLILDSVAVEGKNYNGTLCRDGIDHYLFVETDPDRQVRNPRVFNGKHVTITCRKDGTLHPNLRQVTIGKGFNASQYAKAVADELKSAISCLVEN